MAAIHFGPQEECNAHIRKQLGQLAEPKFQQFMAKLLPGVENILGVRLPKGICRKKRNIWSSLSLK